MQDHKAGDEEEVARITSMGGFVVRDRVLGILAVSRSFGDHGLKAYVSAQPHTTRTLLGPQHPFVILACDGVWDVVEDQVND